MEIKMIQVSEKLDLVRKDISQLKRELSLKESELVGLLKEQRDLKEEYRMATNRKVVVEYTQRDADIARFRENYPEEVALAKQRDLNGELPRPKLTF